MSDLISRQDAIKAICEDGTWLEGQGCTDISMAERKQRDADILSDLPSIDAVPKGRWIDNMYCSECGWVHEAEPGFIGYVDGFNFCPRCGADMREGVDTDE